MAWNTFSAGVNTSFSSELNENFNLGGLQVSNNSIDATEYSTSTGAPGTLVKTFTVTPGNTASNYVAFLKGTIDVKSDAASGRCKVFINDQTNPIVDLIVSYGSGYVTVDIPPVWVGDQITDSISTSTASISKSPLDTTAAVDQASITIKVYLTSGNGTDLMYCQNTKFDVGYFNATS